MKRLFLLLVLLFSVPLCGCTPSGEDYFASFSGEFEAQIVGELYGTEIAARICVRAPNENGVRAATLTFYAPQALCDTVLSRDEAGMLTLTSGKVTASGKAVEGYAPLLQLFPSEGQVHAVELEDDRTRVVGEGFCITFSSDGMPILVENDAISARVLYFAQK